MQDVFLGVDQEDFLYLESLSPKKVFLSQEQSTTCWSRVISCAKEIAIGSQKKVEAAASIVHKSEIYSLPIRPWVLHKLLPEGKRRAASIQWAEAKARSVSSMILGGGREERTYFDSVSRQLGEEVYHLFYAPFIQKRFGVAGKELSSSLARRLHFYEEERVHTIYSTPNSIESEHIYWGASIEKLHVQDGRICSVLVDGEEHQTDGKIYVALPLDHILSLLEDVPKSICVDAQYISYKDEHWIEVSGDCSSLSSETYFIDSDHPVIFAQKLGENRAVVSFDASQDKANVLQWLAGKSMTVIQEGVVLSWMPIWKTQSHFRYRRIASYLQSLGIQLVGKRALFSHKSMLELHWLQQKYSQMEITEFLRVGNVN